MNKNEEYEKGRYYREKALELPEFEGDVKETLKEEIEFLKKDIKCSLFLFAQNRKK